MIKESEYQDLLHISNWKKAKWEVRLSALQHLENHQASKQGRSPCKVQPISTNYNGYFKMNAQKVFISNELLKNPNNVYQAVDTVLHEGRHATQLQYIEEGYNPKKTELWKINFREYFTKEDSLYMYLFQPIERDAFGYALKELKQIYESLEKKFGPDIGYEKHVGAKEYITQVAECMAIKDFGKDYISEVDKTVKLAYEISQRLSSVLSNDDDRFAEKNLSSILKDAYNERKELAESIDKSIDLER